MDPETLLTGDNLAYLEAQSANGTGVAGPRIAPRSIFNPRGASKAPADSVAIERHGKVVRMIHAWRVFGHRNAHLDPLQATPPAGHPELVPSFYGLGSTDLPVKVSTNPLYGIAPYATVQQVIAHVEKVYAGRVGVEYMHISDPEQRRWLQERFEGRFQGPSLSKARRARVLEMLTRAEGFERFLAARFTGAKRFSLEGGETLIPLLDLALSEAASRGVKEAVIGMAHRGRLNVLLNILQKPPATMLAEFAGKMHGGGSQGDVKYHLGYSSDYTTAEGAKVHLSLAFNPSHLEFVNPVVEGRVRAKQDRFGDSAGTLAMPILIHGDAAFAGQGVVPETLNLAGLEGYKTGGTLHIVINNQVGFTTSPHDSRSTLYCTDIAKMLGVPIFHVNGDDPEEVAAVVKIAVEWRQTFGEDAVIDMTCFRRHGHNETDEPAFTQPEMYRRIAAHPGIRAVYARTLIEGGVLTEAESEAMQAAFLSALDTAMKDPPASPKVTSSPLHNLWSTYTQKDASEPNTAVALDRLKGLLVRMNQVPGDFTVHPKVQRLFKLREEQALGQKPLDWAAGELLAYATLVTEGAPVRLSGQDCRRGTFSHRHAYLTDNKTNLPYAPIANLEPKQARFEVYNSHLSEVGVLGFEFGYSLDYPDALVIWEAQFGDFANGAQPIIDNFLVSAEAKWNRLSGLTLFLPHGYEGQGPEHSSARLERFLQLAGEDNIQVVVPTTPAQVFHMLRRQVRRNVRKPLVVFTPKSLLRSPAAVSSLDELASGSFQPVIGDVSSDVGNGEALTGAPRVVLCAGKVYYELAEARAKAGKQREVALVRVEQLYPLPLAAIQAELAKHPGATVVWCQEEPKNMGAWSHIALSLLDAGIAARFAGRPASASPATGFPDHHAAEQKALVADALGLA